jgi:BMFP domain-containing protein YqiC
VSLEAWYGRAHISGATAPTPEIAAMTQTNNPFLDQFAKMMTDAAGAAQGVRREVETVMKAQGEKVLNTMDVVKREEFEVVKAMAERARTENEKLEARIVALEAVLGIGKPTA